MDHKALEIVKRAVRENHLDRLLLGKPEYSYLPKWSPAPGNTDLTTLLSFIYDEPLGISDEEIRDRLLNAVNRIISLYEGLFPVATIILIESLRLSDRRIILGLPLDEISSSLSKSIDEFKQRLSNDKTEYGMQWDDGMLGEMRRISNNIVELGGPKIV